MPSVRQTPNIIGVLGYAPEPQPATPAERLAYTRRRLGLTQEDLAAILDVDPVTILRWEKGDCLPPSKKLERLRELLPAACVVNLR